MGAIPFNNNKKKNLNNKNNNFKNYFNNNNNNKQRTGFSGRDGPSDGLLAADAGLAGRGGSAGPPTFRSPPSPWLGTVVVSEWVTLARWKLQ